MKYNKESSHLAFIYLIWLSDYIASENYYHFCANSAFSSSKNGKKNV